MHKTWNKNKVLSYCLSVQSLALNSILFVMSSARVSLNPLDSWWLLFSVFCLECKQDWEYWHMRMSLQNESALTCKQEAEMLIQCNSFRLFLASAVSEVCVAWWNTALKLTCALTYAIAVIKYLQVALWPGGPYLWSNKFYLIPRQSSSESTVSDTANHERI